MTDTIVQMMDATKQLQGTGFRAGIVGNSAAYGAPDGMDPGRHLRSRWRASASRA